MGKFLKASVLVAISLLLFVSCKERAKTETTEVAPIKVSIQRLEPELVACKNQAEVLSFLNKRKSIAEAYFQVPAQEFPNLAAQLWSIINNPGLKEFYEQSKEPAFFQNVSDIEADFSELFTHLSAYDSTFKAPKIYTLFMGFMSGAFKGFLFDQMDGLYVSDSLVVIGLDFFMGKKAKFRPQVYDYQLRRYQREYIVPTAALVYSYAYNETDLSNKTLLSDMVFAGKGLTFSSAMMPTKNDSLFLHYTGQQLAETTEAQDLVWAHLINEQLLYKTDQFIKGKYMGDAPSTPSVGPRCPGSIGRWVGWRIVRKLQETNPDLSLKQLMQMADAQKLLEASKYRGQVE
ncbi:MAG: gliding motility protein [Spirosomataceae bacterium]